MESEASVDGASSSDRDEVTAQTSFDGSLNEDLFGDTVVQRPGSP